MKPVSTLLLVLAATLPGQESRPTTTSAPAVAEARAKAALHALAEHNGKAKTLRSEYVQLRTTALRKKPLESKGTLLFRADPGCIVFEVSEPKPTRIRLDSKAYEVLRPDQHQLERFTLASSDLPKALFESLRADWDRLLSRLRFSEATLSADGKGLRVRFEPRDESVRPYLKSLELLVASDGSSLHEVGYVDGQDDKITIVLTKLELDPALPGDPFDVPLPLGVVILEHSVDAPGQKKGK